MRQVGINPPIRGSIVWTTSLCQDILCLNPPIRGSIETDKMTDQVEEYLYQSPYKGFNSYYSENLCNKKESINPPIRGSIDNAEHGIKVPKPVSIPL